VFINALWVDGAYYVSVRPRDSPALAGNFSEMFAVPAAISRAFYKLHEVMQRTGVLRPIQLPAAARTHSTRRPPRAH
jgi:hypothetical protein